MKIAEISNALLRVLAITAFLSGQAASSASFDRLEKFKADYDNAKTFEKFVDSLAPFADEADRKYLKSILDKRRDMPPVKIKNDSLVFDIPGSPLVVTLVDPGKGDFKINGNSFTLNMLVTAKENVRNLEKILSRKKDSTRIFELIPQAQARMQGEAQSSLGVIATFKLMLYGDPNADPDFDTDEKWCIEATAFDFSRRSGNYGHFLNSWWLPQHQRLVTYHNFVETKCKPTVTRGECAKATKTLDCIKRVREKMKVHYRYRTRYETDYPAPGTRGSGNQ